MKTIADFKRAMVVGSIWHTWHYFLKNDTLPKDMGNRECVVVQSNSFGFRNPETGKTSWCNWPKKNEFKTVGDKTIQIQNEFMCLTYTKILDKVVGDIYPT